MYYILPHVQGSWPNLHNAKRRSLKMAELQKKVISHCILNRNRKMWNNHEFMKLLAYYNVLKPQCSKLGKTTGKPVGKCLSETFKQFSLFFVYLFIVFFFKVAMQYDGCCEMLSILSIVPKKRINNTTARYGKASLLDSDVKCLITSPNVPKKFSTVHAHTRYLQP